MSIFSKIQARKVGSNTFNLSHDRKMSLNMGELVPIFLMECVPGDSIRMNTSQMLRFAPMVAPVMHNVNVYTHFFFVPNRLVWSNWETFITGGEDGTEEPAFPYTEFDNLPTGSLGDYLGLPTNNEADPLRVSAIPFAAYNKIWNDYYRDQNLQPDKADDTLLNGSNSDISLGVAQSPKRRSWQHDYFTSALPWTQKGPEATIPIQGNAPIGFDNSAGDTYLYRDGQSSPISGQGDVSFGQYGRILAGPVSPGEPVNIDNSQNLYVDMSEATATTINELRRAFRLQEWLEKNARGGSRYIESILSHFGVKSSDARLQRPEFLGGSSAPVTISEVLQTSDASAQETPQGNMAGHGISVGGSNGFKYFCEEHGYIIGIMSVMPKTAYFQGVPRHFFKFDKFDYYWPSFAHLGEQPIYNKELYTTGIEEDDEGVFGYVPRYAEYKYLPSTVHGEFRTSLDFWHMARKFEDTPKLNADFIEADPTDRIFAVTDAEKLYAHVHHRVSAKRKMPYFGSPTI